MNPALGLRLVATVEVSVGEFIHAGEVPGGTRRIIPITGGRATGPIITGDVEALGADWNLLRSDGTETVSARYVIRTDDDVTLSIRNEGVIAEGTAGRIGVTSLQIEAPRGGRYEWLNDAVLVGSLSAEESESGLLVVLQYWNVEITPATP